MSRFDDVHAFGRDIVAAAHGYEDKPPSVDERVTFRMGTYAVTCFATFDAVAALGARLQRAKYYGGQTSALRPARPSVRRGKDADARLAQLCAEHGTGAP